MTRKLSQAQDGASRMLSIRLPPALHEALEREAARRSQAAGGIPVSTAAVVRAMIERGLGGDQVPADQVLAAAPAAPVKRRRATPAVAPTSSAAIDDGDPMRVELLACGLSGRAIAERAGVRREAVNRYLRGADLLAHHRAALVAFVASLAPARDGSGIE